MPKIDHITSTNISNHYALNNEHKHNIIKHCAFFHAGPGNITMGYLIILWNWEDLRIQLTNQQTCTSKNHDN
jgi:hypothetical protein